MLENGLIRNLRLISKCMKSQTGQQVIIIHTMPNIIYSISQPGIEIWSVKIEYSMINIVFVKLGIKCDGKTSPRPFYHKRNLRIYTENINIYLCNSKTKTAIFIAKKHEKTIMAVI